MAKFTNGCVREELTKGKGVNVFFTQEDAEPYVINRRYTGGGKNNLHKTTQRIRVNFVLVFAYLVSLQCIITEFQEQVFSE